MKWSNSEILTIICITGCIKPLLTGFGVSDDQDVFWTERTPRSISGFLEGVNVSARTHFYAPSTAQPPSCSEARHKLKSLREKSVKLDLRVQSHSHKRLFRNSVSS